MFNSVSLRVFLFTAWLLDCKVLVMSLCVEWIFTIMSFLEQALKAVIKMCYSNTVLLLISIHFFFHYRKWYLCCLGDVSRPRAWKWRGRGLLLLRQWLIWVTAEKKKLKFTWIEMSRAVTISLFLLFIFESYNCTPLSFTSAWKCGGICFISLMCKLRIWTEISVMNTHTDYKRIDWSLLNKTWNV